MFKKIKSWFSFEFDLSDIKFTEKEIMADLNKMERRVEKVFIAPNNSKYLS